MKYPFAFAATALCALAAQSLPTGQQPASPARRNLIIFVADGLRPGSINARDTPTIASARAAGVNFTNSHAVFPTFTTSNASAIATGHGLGDTGDFGNTLWTGYAVFDTGNFGLKPGTPVPYLEDNQVLSDLDHHSHGNYLGEDTLLAAARARGYHTAAVGKVGPVAIQDASELAPINGLLPTALPGIVVDDATGAGSGFALPPQLIPRLTKEHVSLEAPGRTNGYGGTSQYNNNFPGDYARPGTLAANTVQQQWFVDVTTRAILPLFEADTKAPFILLFWSRDPDGTQHNQGDSLGALFPGINGPTSKLGVQNADRSLKQILAWVDARPTIKASTDVFVISDHGFATISRREMDRSGRRTSSESAKHVYVDASGRVDTEQGMLPNGFLAVDLALAMNLNVYDPDSRVSGGSASPYKRMRLETDVWEHPIAGNGLIGRDVQRLDGKDATVIVAANGGSDLIYVPDKNPSTVKTIVDALLSFDYVSGVFVDDAFGAIDGTLALSTIGLAGTSALGRPAIVVPFKSFYFNPDDLMTAVQVSDTGHSFLQEGQGMHGGFGRENTFNTMIAFGPDFKRHYVDAAPVGNMDLAPTIAHLLGFELRAHGSIVGRVMREALLGQAIAAGVSTVRVASVPAGGKQTVLFLQEFGGEKYFRAACFPVNTRMDEMSCR
jgi:arylsulfatase A-like enzyme